MPQREQRAQVGLIPDDAGEGGGLADRAAGIGAGRAEAQRAATAAAEPPEDRRHQEASLSPAPPRD